uniref:VWFA domain-containing protein n=1 Tax=Salarias fasciatus TaxID=181472 RepID=A0A672FS09_SALFA
LPSTKEAVLSIVRGASHHVEETGPTAGPGKMSSEKSDIVFLIDGSYDSRNGFEEIRSFLENVIENLNVGNNNDQVAVVQYSRDVTPNFYLNSYSSKNDILTHLSNVQLKGGLITNTGVAIEYVKDTVFTPSSGSRAQQGVPQILIVLSGRKSEDDVTGPVERLRSDGTVIFGIGINKADRLEMEQVAPRAEYFMKETSDFPVVRQHLSMICPKSSVNRDIVFLIDGSDDVRTRFNAIREFLVKTTESFDLDERKDQVAVVQYSNNPELSFSLDAYTTKADVLKHIASLKPKGGRPHYIGKALQFVKDNVFVSNAGGRPRDSTKQILVVLAGGRSRDSPRGPASMLKAAGVVAFAVGSRSSNSAEMQAISSDPNYIHIVPDFASLPLIEQSLRSQLSDIGVDEETREGKNHCK